MSLPRIPVRPFAALTDELDAAAVASTWQQKRFIWEDDAMPNVSGERVNRSANVERGVETFRCPSCGAIFDLMQGGSVLRIEQNNSREAGILFAASCPCCRSLLHWLQESVRQWAKWCKSDGKWDTDAWHKDFAARTGLAASLTRKSVVQTCGKCGSMHRDGLPVCGCK